MSPYAVKYAQLNKEPTTTDIMLGIKNFMNSRNFLVFSIGCTGGKHRSVYLVEKINNILANKLIIKKHRDLL